MMIWSFHWILLSKRSYHMFLFRLDSKSWIRWKRLMAKRSEERRKKRKGKKWRKILFTNCLSITHQPIQFQFQCQQITHKKSMAIWVMDSSNHKRKAIRSHWILNLTSTNLHLNRTQQRITQNLQLKTINLRSILTVECINQTQTKLSNQTIWI